MNVSKNLKNKGLWAHFSTGAVPKVPICLWAFFAFGTGIGEARAEELFGVDTILFGNARLRYENTRQDGFTETANGLTLSLRTGIEATLLPKVRVLVEGETVFAPVDDFNDGTGDNPQFPVILDPDTLELNRAQIQVELNDQTFLTIGRQVLKVDDQRFIGEAPFRQNQQTFDAVHFATRTKSGNTFQAGYIDQNRTPLGSDNINGRLSGESYFLNTNIGTPLGRFGAFHYAFDLETGLATAPNSNFSSTTTGVRYDGRWHADEIGLDIEGAFAKQRDFADNPSDFNATYWLAGIRGFYGPARAGFRAESLGSDNGVAIQTPNGSRHKFQGEGDIFLITPDTGVVDFETSAAWAIGQIGPFRNVTLSSQYHWFQSAINDDQLGTEFDVKLSASYDATKLSFTLTDYRADTFFEDTRRIYITVSRRF